MNYRALMLSIMSILMLVSIASAADVAYIVKNSLGVDSYLISQINQNGFSTETVFEANLATKNLSDYRIVIIGDQNLDNPTAIGIQNYRSIILNSYDYYETSLGDKQLGWSRDQGSVSSPGLINLKNSADPIALGVPLSFRAYTAMDPNVKVFYLKGQKPSGTSIVAYPQSSTADAVVAYLTPGKTYLNGVLANQRTIFFGITRAQYWTQESKTLFKNSLNWILVGEDRDNDGFYSDLDCDDTNAGINPDATETPYDGIDQNCDGFDLVDVDNDGYASELVGGLDCDDNNITINPLNPDKTLNCINDAPVVQSIPDQILTETQTITTIVFAMDYENDSLIYSIDSPLFNQTENTFSWKTTYDDAGDYTFNVNVSDGINTATSSFNVRVINRNRSPTIQSIPEQSWPEDTQFTLNLSEYIKDSDGDILKFGIESTSNDTNILLTDVNGSLFTFNSITDWNGQDWVSFWASDNTTSINTPRVYLNVLPVNDAPTFLGNISDITFNEDSLLNNALDLSNYFQDIDSQLNYSIAGSSNIQIILNNSILSFSSAQNWNGQENITIQSTDGEYNISSNIFSVTVLNTPDTPEFENFSCATEISEDSSNSCIIKINDAENDTINLSVENSSNIICTIDNQTLSYSPVANYSGDASCTLKAEDIDGSVYMDITFNVLPINDPIELIKPIENITFNEDTQFTLNLSEYLTDIDSQLSYNATSSLINMSMSGSILNLIPFKDWNGEDNITIQSTDGEYSLSQTFLVKVNPTDEQPIFENNSCLLSINEDNEYQCTLNASDLENDTLTFSALNSSHLSCSVNETILTYKPSLNFNGNASCTVIVSDKDGNTSQQFSVEVMPINDAPIILNPNPADTLVSLLQNAQKTFSILPQDIDSTNISTRWTLNNEFVGAGNSYTFSKPAGVYILESLVSDQELGTTKYWNIIVGDLSQFTCSQANGHVCSSDQVCPGTFLGVSDTLNCCSMACQTKPAVIKNADMCSERNKDIIVEITRPKTTDEIKLGDDMRITVDITNYLNSTQDFTVKAQLYDNTKEKVIDSDKQRVEIEKNRKESVSFYIKVPEDLEAEDIFKVVVKVSDDACNDDSQTVKIERPEDKVQISKINLPDSAICGGTINGYVELENLGSDDQTISLSLENKALNISKSISNINLDSYSSKDNSLREKVQFKIPDKAKEGNYTIQAIATYNSQRISSSHTITIESCQEEKKTISTQGINKEELGDIVLNKITEDKTDNTMLFVVIINAFLLVAALAASFYFLRSR